MGDILGKLFIDVDDLPGLKEDPQIFNVYGFIQLLFLAASYGFVLFTASGMISDGSELLLCTKFKNLVGSVVLPILGAVPDGAIILFSGTTQDTLAVGVGALAGSTIMLLTIPWALAIVSGRVRTNDSGQPDYSKIDKGEDKGQRRAAGSWATQMFDTSCGIETNDQDKSKLAPLGWFMLLTSTSYLVIQGPAFQLGCKNAGCGCVVDLDKDVEDYTPAEKKCFSDKADAQSIWAQCGLYLSIFFFVLYMGYNFMDANQQENRNRKAEQTADRYVQQGINLHGICRNNAFDQDVLIAIAKKKFKELDKDNSQTLDFDEIQHLVQRFDSGERSQRSDEYRKNSQLFTQCRFAMEGQFLRQESFITIMRQFMKAEGPFGSARVKATKDHKDGEYMKGDTGTFETGMGEDGDMYEIKWDGNLKTSKVKWPKSGTHTDFVIETVIPDVEGPPSPEAPIRPSPRPSLEDCPSKATDSNASGGDEDDEEDEMPEEWRELPPEEQIYLIWRRSITLMLGGTGLVLLFADPACDVLNALGTMTGVPAFYVSFCLAPLASNAAELLSAMQYASKQTKASFTVGVSQLLGAACMNNTFCLAIFLLQIYQNHLVWEFSAETIAILLIELIMFGFSQMYKYSTWMSPVIMMMFPLSIALVYLLENIVGID